MADPTLPAATLGEPTAVRLDRALVERGLARSRGQARDLVEAGAVEVDGVVVGRVSQRLAPTQSVRVRPGEASGGVAAVGRGFRKLDHALNVWGPAAAAVAGARCLDAGASTGGFTQVLLDRGAREVVALDVGHGQLAPSLRGHPRVVDRSGVNLRDVGPEEFGGRFDVVVADLSFISLTLVFPRLRAMCRPDGQAVVLVKPQFESGGRLPGRSGVVRHAADRAAAVISVAESAQRNGWAVRDIVRSPVTGGSGNVEYLLWLTEPAPGHRDPDAVRSRVWAVVTGAEPMRRSP